MNFCTKIRAPRSGLTKRLLGLMLMALAAPFAVSPASAQDADHILKSMYDYIASQKNISMSYDADVEVVTPGLQKIQFTSSGKILLSRPDKLRATRTGGYSDVELVADGKTVSIVGKNLNAYTQRDASGSVDDLIGRLRDDSGLDLPGADLILARGYDDMMSDVVESAHIGRGVVDGVECEHLAFRGDDVDWQIWVEMGPRPIPRKYVITSKSVGSGPQYTIRVKDWKSDAQIPADAFVFTPAPDMKKVDLSTLANIDEIPQAAPRDKTTGSGGSSK